jgi:hypothetical protein
MVKKSFASKYGTAHFNIYIFGSKSLAIASKTTIFVMRVANYPSNFMLLSLIMSNMPDSTYIP